MPDFWQFVVQNWPRPEQFWQEGVLYAIWGGGVLWFSGFLKVCLHLNTGYTRKIAHFAIFLTAFAIQSAGEMSSLFLFGAIASLFIAAGLLLGDGNFFYEAIAREKDRPHQRYYIVVPYLATIVGGLLGTWLFGKAALFGYLVAGLGDAAGEPVGTRWGKHRYSVPALSAVRATRSLEGSAAVWLVSTAAILGAALLTFDLPPTPGVLGKVLLIGFVAAVVEAISPHGWDNATMQLLPAWLASLLLLP
ncbi:MAG: hypothetical protein KDI06_16630 [Calditrichaeota bacterium]|nr:hypothetical protein [Calditrichota bacterium]